MGGGSFNIQNLKVSAATVLEDVDGVRVPPIIGGITFPGFKFWPAEVMIDVVLGERIQYISL